MTPESIIRRSASGSAIFPKRDSTCQRRARKPSIWSVIPATSQTIPAGHVWASPACTIRTTKRGISTSRTSVSAFGSWASGADTTRVAIPTDSTAGLRSRMEAPGPVGRAREIGGLGGDADEAPGAVVVAVAAVGGGRLDLCPLPPLVVARDRHHVRLRGERGRPEVVVGDTGAARAQHRSLPGADAVVARADARRAQQVHDVRLRTEPRELGAAVVDEVVGVEAVEQPGGAEADELRAGKEAHPRRQLRPHRRPIRGGDVARVVDEDVANAEGRQVLDVLQHGFRGP